MRLRLWHRLFFAFALLSLAALLGLTWSQQRLFERGFLDYVNRQQVEHVEAAAQRLGRRYAVSGSWNFLREDRRLFRELVIDDGRIEADGTTSLPPPQSRQQRPPPQSGRKDDPRGEPPDRDHREDRRPPPPPMGRGQPPPGGAPPNGLLRRVALLDAERRMVTGNGALARDLPTVPVTVGTQTVGYLRYEPLPKLNSDVDVAFARSFTDRALLAALVILLMALAIALAVARWLLAPVKAVADGARALAAGNYSARIKTGRKDELGALAEDFNRAAAALENHRTARQQWTADIAYELRTPVTILQGEIQALREGIRSPSPEALASLDQECQRLTRLIEDLYQLALSDSGALDYRFARVDLAAVVADVVAAQTPLMQAAGLTLTLNLSSAQPLWLSADAERLKQLFANIVANAQRYTDAPGRVNVTVTALDGVLHVTVDDTPPGVAGEHLAKLFDRLYRADPSRARTSGGAGLGLSICKNIVSAHGGDIRATASPMGGLQVRTSLPISANRVT
jgi:two-component system, OmpR family, sensor histidine kinase BaeS